MSEVLPEPPIPPPLAPALALLQKNETIMTRQDEDNDEDNSIKSLYDLNLFVKKTITKIKSVTQTGPNCGMAALSMVCLLTPSQLTINNIFNEAHARGFTNNGEMFSAFHMKELAEIVLTPWFHVEIFINGLIHNLEAVLDRLYNGDLMLVPYDADKDHSPSCLGGHKAHWALVCGVLCTADGTVHVAARHGKSRHLAIWLLQDLARSNENLAELDPSRVADSLIYVLPPGGLQQGLASKFIMMRKT